MFRWAPTFIIGALTAILLALLEPALAASDAGKILFICLLLALFRSPLWFVAIYGSGREGRT